MKDKKRVSLPYESIEWLKTLDKLQEENIGLKKRLAEFARLGGNSAFLEKMEFYHNSLLNKDDMISLLRHEIVEFENLNENKKASLDGLHKFLIKKHNKLQDEMGKVEIGFSRLKIDFDNDFKKIVV